MESRAIIGHYLCDMKLYGKPVYTSLRGLGVGWGCGEWRVGTEGSCERKDRQSSPGLLI